METLFGVPMGTLMLIMLGLVGTVLLLLLLVTLRNLVAARMGLRNIPRRRAQTALIVAGLTLSTVIITSALGTGDTLTHSIRSSAIEQLGLVDEQVQGPPTGPQGLSAMTQAQFDELRAKLTDDPDIDGIAPRFSRNLAVTAPGSGQGEPGATVFATDSSFEQSFGSIAGTDGTALPLSALADDEVYLNERGASALSASAGDELDLYATGRPERVRIKAIVRDEGLLEEGPVVVMPLERARTLFSAPDELRSMLISNVGDEVEGAKRSDEVTRRVRLLVSKPEVAEQIRDRLAAPAATAAIDARIAELERARSPQPRLLEQARTLRTELASTGASDALRALLADDEFASWLTSLKLPAAEQEALGSELAGLSSLQVNDNKARALERANQTGNLFFSFFLIFGTFSVMAGLLLIFLIFVMLAAERKSEMGMARAVGMQRRHLIQSFLAEGMVYDILAAGCGVLVGLGVSWVMVQVMASAFDQFSDTGFSLTLRFLITPYSLVIAFCLGILLTFVTVTFSAWRVSRLNIVAAIRDLPEMESKPRLITHIIRFLRSLLLILAGLAAMAGGYRVEQAALVFAGLSQAIIGAGLLLASILGRTPVRRSIADRIVYTLTGLCLVVPWMAPGATGRLLGTQDFETGEAFFILAGIFAVMGGVWLLVYNVDLLLGMLNLLFGRLGNMAPILKTATAYPLVSKFRTGMTVAMFGLIIFVLVILSTFTSVNRALFSDRGAITGGYDIAATVNGENRIGDLREALVDKDEIDPGAFDVITPVAETPLEVRQIGASKQSWSRYIAAAAGPTYFDTVPDNFAIKHVEGFPDDDSVWRALRERDDVVLLQRANLPSRQGEQGGGPLSFELEGAYIEDETLPAFQLELRIPGTDRVRKVTAVGVLEGSFTLPLIGFITNDATMKAFIGTSLPPSQYLVKTIPGGDAVALAQQLEKAFLTEGMNASSLNDTVDRIQAGSSSFTALFKGFLALGLIVGIAALGVISSRAVVERRQQIGMLRAIGYQARMVQLSFLIESSFITILGIALGTGLGLLLSASLIADFAAEMPGLRFNPPWGEIGLIVLGSYLFSLVATYWPAHSAARIYPAEALRYE